MVRRAPRDARFRLNLAAQLRLAGSSERAVGLYGEFLELGGALPFHEVVHFAVALVSRGRLRHAVDLYRGVVPHGTHVPVSASFPLAPAVYLRTNLATIQQLVLDVRAATRTLLGAAGQHTLLLVRQALALIPMVPTRVQDVLEARRRTVVVTEHLLRRVQAGLLALSAAAASSPDVLLGDMAYYSTYSAEGSRGRSERQLRLRISQLVISACGNALGASESSGGTVGELVRGDPVGSPVALPVSARLPPQLARKLRVGFVSAFFRSHSVGKMISRLISHLPRSLFHVEVLYIGARAREDPIVATVARAADHIEQLGSDSAAHAVAA